MTKPEIQSRLRQDGLLFETMTPEAFAGFIEAERVRWKPVVERAGLTQK